MKDISWGFIALSGFFVFLTFLYIVLFNFANLGVERERKTVVACEAHLPNTVLPWSPNTGWKGAALAF